MSAAPDHSTRGHSPLGASGAERWMNCVGSVNLIKRLRALLTALGIPEEDDPDYRREGTAMHEAGEHCLRNGLDTWEIIGQVFNETTIDGPMADAIQMYLDYVRQYMGPDWAYHVEFPISSPVHPDFFGSLDFGAVWMGNVGPVKIVDLKGGEGIAVDAEDNPQLKYYAFGIIDALESGEFGAPMDPDTPVEIAIVQPRAFHVDGPIREWETTVGELKTWVHEELVPAMNATAEGTDLDAGPWCRFCPAKLVCPLLTGLFKAAATLNPKEVVAYDNATLARSYRYRQAVKFYVKALEDETFRRLNNGHDEGFEGVAKLVPKKSNRVWTPSAAAKAKQLFGPEAFTPAEMKSPAELEKISPKAREFVKEHSYHPNTGLTVASWDDAKPAVKVKTSQDTFAASVAAILKEEGLA